LIHHLPVSSEAAAQPVSTQVLGKCIPDVSIIINYKDVCFVFYHDCAAIWVYGDHYPVFRQAVSENL